jgi:hypothetical protein
MIHYSFNNLSALDNSTLQNFVDTFNKSLKQENIKHKIISDPESFFKYWIKFINQNGMKLYKKILKLVGAEFNIQGNETIFKLNNDLLDDVVRF